MSLIEYPVKLNYLSRKKLCVKHKGLILLLEMPHSTDSTHLCEAAQQRTQNARGLQQL